MAGSDAAKLSKVLEAAFQMELKLSYPGAEIEEQAIEVAGLNRKGLTWQINRPLASPIKPILALDAKTGEFHREPCFLGKGITVKRNSPTSQPNANA